MSALVAQPQSRQKSAAPGPRKLRPLPTKAPQRSNAPFIGLVAAVLGVGMAGAILLNTVIEQQSRTLQDLQEQSASLANQQAMLEAEVNHLRSPQVVVLKATDLGMVPNPNAVYIDLTTGEIIGEPTAVTGDELPNITEGLR